MVYAIMTSCIDKKLYTFKSCFKNFEKIVYYDLNNLQTWEQKTKI